MSYGKLFSSCFTGSMAGSGTEVFAVWSYVIANTVQGQVELNPIILAAMLGSERTKIADAIGYLCQPDPASRNKAEEGRRLVKEGQFAYRVVTHFIYRGMKDEDERREYNREKQRESRARKSVNSSTSVKGRQDLSTQAEAEAEKTHTPSGFDEFWKAYPNRKGKGDAEKVWVKMKCNQILPQILVSLRALKISEQWANFRGKYIPYPAKWLRGKGWEDETAPTTNGTTTRHIITPQQKEAYERSIDG